MRALVLICVAAVFSSTGCKPQEQTPQVDLAAERTALMNTDRAWSESVDDRLDVLAKTDMEKFLAFFAEEAFFLPADAPIAQGEEAIRAATKLFFGPGVSLSWKSTTAQVSESADLAYTIGTYQLTMNDAKGNPVTTVGKYLTAWRKQADGQWKVVADCFNSD